MSFSKFWVFLTIYLLTTSKWVRKRWIWRPNDVSKYRCCWVIQAKYNHLSRAKNCKATIRLCNLGSLAVGQIIWISYRIFLDFFLNIFGFLSEKYVNGKIWQSNNSNLLLGQTISNFLCYFFTIQLNCYYVTIT